jgi:hypothetical protein
MRAWLRRLAVTIGALVLATMGMVAITSAPASALPAGCSASYLCIYPDPNYSGGFGHFSGSNPDWRQFSTSTSNCGNGTWDNCISAAYNDGTSCTAHLWSSYSYTGSKLNISRGSGYPNLANVGFDDTTSSNNWC